MTEAGAIFGAYMWAAMVWFFAGPAVTKRLRRVGTTFRPPIFAPRTASASRKGSDTTEPGMAGGVAGSVAAGTPRPRDSSLRSALRRLDAPGRIRTSARPEAERCRR